MDTGQNPAVSVTGARRNEDIALDLMRFIAAQAEIGRGAAVGFTPGASRSGADEQVERLLELYSRCLRAVEGKPRT